jgi:hypothetical protein
VGKGTLHNKGRPVPRVQILQNFAIILLREETGPLQTKLYQMDRKVSLVGILPSFKPWSMCFVNFKGTLCLRLKSCQNCHQLIERRTGEEQYCTWRSTALQVVDSTKMLLMQGLLSTSWGGEGQQAQRLSWCRTPHALHSQFSPATIASTHLTGELWRRCGDASVPRSLPPSSLQRSPCAVAEQRLGLRRP